MKSFITNYVRVVARLCAASVTGVVLMGAAPAVLADAAGDALAKRVYDRPDGNDLVGRGLMALREPNQPERVRRMYSYTRRNAKNDFWGLTRFVAPADIKDTALLSHSFVNGQEDQWVYLPAMKRSRRIPTNRKGGQFVGSDFYYEDLQDRKPSADNHRILGPQSLDGTPTTVLESIPVDPSNSVYRKRVSWIHEGILLPVRIDYFEDSLKKPSKRYQMYRVDQVQGYWTVLDSVMINLKTGHRTRLVTEKVKYDQGLPEDFFSPRSLENSSAEKRYRP